MTKKGMSMRKLLQVKRQIETIKATAELERQQAYADAYQRSLRYASNGTAGSAASSLELVVAAWINEAGKQRADEKYARTVADATDKIVQELTGKPATYLVIYTLEQSQFGSKGARTMTSRIEEANLAAERLISRTVMLFQVAYGSADLRVSRTSNLEGHVQRLGLDGFAVSAPSRQQLEDLPDQFRTFKKGDILQVETLRS